MLREELDCQLPVEVLYNGPLEMTHEVLTRFEARLFPRTSMRTGILAVVSIKGVQVP